MVVWWFCDSHPFVSLTVRVSSRWANILTILKPLWILYIYNPIISIERSYIYQAEPVKSAVWREKAGRQ